MMRQRMHDKIVRAIGSFHAETIRRRDATISAQGSQLAEANRDIRRLAEAMAERGLTPPDGPTRTEIIDAAIGYLARVPKPREPRSVEPRAVKPRGGGRPKR